MIPESFVPHLPALQIVLPLLAALIAALVRNGTVGWLLALVVSWLMVPVSMAMLGAVLDGGTISYALGGWRPPLGIEYRVDAPAGYLLVLVSAMGALAMTYAPRSLASEIPVGKRGLYYSMYLTCLAGLLGMAITGDAFNVFVFMEISSLAMYAMIAMGKDRRALVAAFQYLIIGTIGATFYVIGIGFLFASTGTLNMVDMALRLQDLGDSRPAFAGLAFIVVGIGLKLAIFPLHLWLPNAYAYSPSVASAFLASTATKVAVYLLLRFIFSVFGVDQTFDDLPLTEFLLVLSAAAMVIASAVAIFQMNVKRMLAYSSVSQIGYITLGIALASQAGLTGGIAHLFNHAIIKACLFFAIGAVVYRCGVVKLDQLAGIGRKMPLTMGAFVIAGLGLIGVPGTAGFVSKWYLILGAAEQGLWLLVIVIVVSSLLAVIYVGRVIEVAWFREPGPALAKASEPPFEILAVTWALAAGTIFFGIFTQYSGGVAGDAAMVLLDGIGPSDATPLLTRDELFDPTVSSGHVETGGGETGGGETGH